MAVSKKVAERISTQLKRYQPVIQAAKVRDVSESDTVFILGDIMADVFGYKKHEEITTEYAIRGTYVDLAIRVGKELRFLIEAKAIGVPLKEGHVKQAIDYAANQGVEWVILTNGQMWQFYKVHFRQPIDKSLVFELDLLALNHKDPQFIECFGNLSRECFTTNSITEFFSNRIALSRYSLAAALLSDPILATLKRELKKLAPKLKVDETDLRFIIENEVVKRDLLESDEGKKALADFKKALKANQKLKLKVVPTVSNIADMAEATVVLKQSSNL